jgi:hypothetical protein
MTCEHPSDECSYWPSRTDAGWRCDTCEAELGLRPDLDRQLIEVKVSGLLHSLSDGNLIFVPDATEGEFITHNVANQCKTRDRYDQYTILRLILDEPNVKETAESLFKTYEQESKARAVPSRNF